MTQKLAGHASITTTIKHYTGIMPEALREAQGRLPFRDAIGGVSKSDRGAFSTEEGRGGKTMKFPRETD